MYSEAKWFLITLSSTIPIPDSSTACCARGMRAWLAARDAARKILSTCSHYGTIFGDILLIGVKMEIEDYSIMKAGDDAEELQFFDIGNLPEIAFYCHNKFINEFKSEK